MCYRVIVSFVDMQDNLHEYGVGDKYPRRGHETTAERIQELSTWENSRGVPLIEKVEEDGILRNKTRVRKPLSERKK